MPGPMAETTRRFLDALPAAQRTALEQLREMILRAAPAAEEYVGYGIPAFRLDGPLVSFGAAKSHCALYVQSPAVMAALADDLVGLDTSKGTIRFTPDKPLPEALVARIVRARITENAALMAARKATRRQRPRA